LNSTQQELFATQSVEDTGVDEWYAKDDSGNFIIVTILDYDSGEVEVFLSISGEECSATLNAYGSGVDDLEEQLAAEGRDYFSLRIQPQGGQLEFFEDSYLANPAEKSDCGHNLPLRFSDFSERHFSFDYLFATNEGNMGFSDPNNSEDNFLIAVNSATPDVSAGAILFFGESQSDTYSEIATLYLHGDLSGLYGWGSLYRYNEDYGCYEFVAFDIENYAWDPAQEL
jgi:hypothetical protein